MPMVSSQSECKKAPAVPSSRLWQSLRELVGDVLRRLVTAKGSLLTTNRLTPKVGQL
jgi:hypothetical protein